MASAAQIRLQEVRAKAQELTARGIRSADESKEVEALLVESRSLRTQVEHELEVDQLNEFSNQTANGLRMAQPGGDGADVVGFKSAGATQLNVGLEGIGRETRRTMEIADQYGEGGLSSAQKSLVGTTAYRSAWLQYMRTPAGRVVPETAYRVLNEAADPQGGFLVPEDLQNRVITRVPTPTRVQGRVTQLQTGRDRIIMPKINYSADDLFTTGMRVTWTGETPASNTVSRVTDPVFGQVGINIYTAMMSLPITNDLLEDSDFPLISYISGKFGETIDLLKDQMVLLGTGQGQPAGILQSPSVGGTDITQVKAIKSGVNGTLGTTNTFFHELMYDLPEQYDDNAAWVFNKVSTEKALAELKDSNGRFLWGSGLQDSGLEQGYKDKMLLGAPVIRSGFMPNLGTGAFPIIYGDLTAYYLINRIGFSVQVLRELYAETNQILILGRIRFGGQIAEPWKLRVGQTSA